MRVGAIRKDMNDRRDYDIGFGRWLPEGDTLVDIEAFVDEGPDSALVIDSASIEGTDAKVWLSGGTANENYQVEVRVTSAEGRIKTACFRVRITDC